MKINIDRDYRLKDTINCTVHGGMMWLNLGVDPDKLEEVVVTPVVPDPQVRSDPRVGKPGEVWQSNFGPDHIAVITHDGHLWIGPRFNMEHINRVGSHAFREAEDDVFLAPTLEAYYQQRIEA
jgi:hypothetical protein